MKTDIYEAEMKFDEPETIKSTNDKHMFILSKVTRIKCNEYEEGIKEVLRFQVKTKNEARINISCTKWYFGETGGIDYDYSIQANCDFMIFNYDEVARDILKQLRELIRANGEVTVDEGMLLEEL